ncbi:MAG TPA: ABC transporter substrate-binding protein [Gaiellaceae bacterium]|nr:ABC transporter substrate-binding protein [Gaiellaceae bacterium]
MRRFKWRGALFALTAAAMVVAVAAGFTVKKNASDIHIAMIAPLTGPYVFVGGPERDAAVKAVAEINAQGGIKGHKLVMDVFDDATSPSQSVQLTQQVISDPKYVAMIGTGFGSAALPDEQVASGKILYISEAAPVAQVQPAKPSIYMVPPNSRLFAYNLAAYLRKHGLTKIGLLHDNGAYPTEGTANVKQYATNGRLDIVDDETFALSTTDFTAILTKLQSTDAQAIWLWNLPQAVAVTKQYRQLGVNKQLVLTGGNATPQYLSPTAACPDANGALINSSVAQVAKFLPKSNPSRAIALHVDALMGQQGNQFYYDGYSAVNIIKAGLLKTNMTTDRQTLISGFENLVKYVGAEGTWIFKGSKHAGLGVNDLVISKIVNCAYQPVPGQALLSPKKKK